MFWRHLLDGGVVARNTDFDEKAPLDLISPNSFDGGALPLMSPRKALARAGRRGDLRFPPLRLRVGLTEPTGAEAHVFERIGSVDVIAVLRERVSLSDGSDIGVSVPADQLHNFEVASQARLN